jgi:hypothetical protein
MSNQTMGNTVPQNEPAVCAETSALNINNEKDKLISDLQEKWIKFIDTIVDDKIENFLWTFGTKKELPYLQFLTLKQFIEYFEIEVSHELSDIEGINIEELSLNSETILDYSEYKENGSLENILSNGYDPEFDSLIEILEFDTVKFISDLQKKKELSIRGHN